MGVYFGDKPPKALWYGDKPITAVYRGAQQIWPLNVWAGAMVSASILSGNAVLARQIAGGLVSVSEITADPARLRQVVGSIGSVSTASGIATRIKGVTGAMVSQSAMSGAVTLVTQKFATGSMDAVSNLLAATSRDRQLDAALSAVSSMTSPASRLRQVYGAFASMSAMDGNVTRLRGLSGAIASASVLSGAATVEEGATGITRTFIDSYVSEANTAAHTFSGIVIPADGLVVVTASSSSGFSTGSITGITIGGSAGSPAVNTGTTNHQCAIYAREVSAGTISVTVNCSSSRNNMVIGVYVLEGYSSATAHDTDFAVGYFSGGTKTNTLDIPANGVCISVAGVGSALSIAFSSATQDFDELTSGSIRSKGATKETETLLTGHVETFTFGSNNICGCVSASWG